MNLIVQKKKVNFLKNLNDGIKEVKEEQKEKEQENSFGRKSQDFSRNMPSFKNMKQHILNKIESSKINIKINGVSSKQMKNNTSNFLISEGSSLYDKSDYEKTLRLGSVIESDSVIEIKKENKLINIIKQDDNESKSKSLKKIIGKRGLEKNSDNIEKTRIENQQNKKEKVSQINNSNIYNTNLLSKSKFKKYYLKIKNLEKKSNSLNQLLFCARVAIENALDVGQAVSSCYKWVEDNYLESQIKKVIKEAKLKEKQKEDKEKYGNIGNLKKTPPAKKKIIRTSDQSFKLLLNMIMGIQIATKSIPNFNIKNNEDLNKYMTNMLYSIQTINFGKKKEEVFILKEFAGIIFNNIRLYLGFEKDDFISSISPQDFITELMISNQTIFEELCSTGKSGSLFYYTRDGKFIVKTIKKDEYKFIKQILPDYYRHLKTYPLSLLPKFLGCYVLTRKVKKKRDKIYFIVMLNVFSTSKHIHIRYDLKGSKIGRRVLIGKRDAEILAKEGLALKDLDLEKRKEKMYIGEKKDILLKQIENDADFLCKIEANDYSLLLGIHYINK